ncbi:MAG: type II/IV secretion system protein, partial [Rhodocyclaceae bacterium]
HCKKAAALSAEEEAQWNELLAPWKSARPAQLYHPVGCLECRMTGYLGRIGIYEILLLSPELKQLIVAAADLAKLREQAAREGMKPLRISGAVKIAAGLTTIEEVLKVAPPAHAR